jgi:hypothetical protein
MAAHFFTVRADEGSRSSAAETVVNEGPVENPAPAPPLSAEARLEEARNRRKHRRFNCDGRAQVCLPNGGLLISGRIVDISIGGCFVESPRLRLERGTLVEVYFETRRLNFRVQGNITALRQGKGVGVTFLHPSFRIARQIRELVRELEMDEQAPEA